MVDNLLTDSAGRHLIPADMANAIRVVYARLVSELPPDKNLLSCRSRELWTEPETRGVEEQFNKNGPELSRKDGSKWMVRLLIHVRPMPDISPLLAIAPFC